MESYAPYLTFLGLDPVPAETARIRVLPLPYDLTSSYLPGARRGPLALLEASTHVELYDELLDAEPYRLGIATLPPPEPDTSGPSAMLQRIRRVATPLVARDRLLLAVGGEHSVTAALVAAHRNEWPGLTVLQLDAHADLRDRFEGSPHNHACVMRRVLEMGVPLVQVGVRSLTREERELIRSHPGVTTHFAHELARRAAADWIREVAASLEGPVYVTVDLDGLDPAVMPATGTPEPGGLGWHEVCALLVAVADRVPIVGADVVELAPVPGLVAPDFLAARLAYRLVGCAARSRGWL